MPKILQNLTDLHITQLNNDENSNYTNWNYTKHTFHIVDELLRQEISWREMPHEEKRYKTCSDLLFEVMNLVYTPIVNLADNRGLISVFYLQIRYLEESTLSADRPITVYRPDRDLSGQIEVYRADRPLLVGLLGSYTEPCIIVQNGSPNVASELPSARGRRFLQPFTNKYALESTDKTG